MSWICKLFKKSSTTKQGIVKTSIDEMDINELELALEINQWILDNGLEALEIDEYLLTLAKFRTNHWEKVGEKENLHFEFFGHRQPYLDNGYECVLEITNYGIYDDFESFKKSDSHNEAMLLPGLTGIAVSINKNWCCVVLGKKSNN